MTVVQVFDKPMCCSTGVCGPQVDPALPKFAADLEWLRSQGHTVERFNLAQQPEAFIGQKDVHQLVTAQGADCLPLVLIDGCIVSKRDYPSRATLAGWVESGCPTDKLPVVGRERGCCGGSDCC